VIVLFAELGPSLHSVVNTLQRQTLADIEVIVVHGATDSPEIAELAGLFGRNQCKSIASGGKRADALNAALSEAAARYVSICDTADRLAPWFFERAVEALDESPRAAFARLAPTRGTPTPADDSATCCDLATLPLRPIAIGGALLRLTAVRSAGGYDADVPAGSETWDLCLTLVEEGFEGLQIEGGAVEAAGDSASAVRRTEPGVPINQRFVAKHRTSFERCLPALLAAQDREERLLADRLAALETELAVWLEPTLPVRIRERDHLLELVGDLETRRRRESERDQLSKHAAALELRVRALEAKLAEAYLDLSAHSGAASRRAAALRGARPPTSDESATSAAIHGVLRAEYGIRPKTVRVLTHGEESVGYLVDAESRQLFAKLHRSWGTEGVNFSLRVAETLHRRLGVRAVVAPIAARGGQLSVDVGGRWLAVFDFIDGVPAAVRPLEAADAARLGRMVRTIHRSSEELALAGVVFDALDIGCVGIIDRLVAEADVESRASGARSDLARLLLDHRENLQSAGNELKALQARCLCRQLLNVATHGDLTLDNVMVAPDGEYFLVDWSQARLAPAERDLLHLAGPAFEAFLRPYVAASSACHLSRDLFAFYLYRWHLEGVAHFGARGLRDNAGVDEVVHDCGVVRGFLPIDARAVERTLFDIDQVARRIAAEGRLQWLA
jgi:spectinomycin phosphotransferase